MTPTVAIGARNCYSSAPAAIVQAPSCIILDPVVVIAYNFLVIKEFFTQIRFSCSL